MQVVSMIEARNNFKDIFDSVFYKVRDSKIAIALCKYHY